MKKVIALCALIVPGLSFSQDSKFSIGINCAPEVAYRTIFLYNTDASNESIFSFAKDLADNMEIPRFGFSSGVTFQYHTGKRLTFQTGVGYSEGGLAEKRQIYSDAIGNIIGEFSSSLRSRYIQVPLNVLYTFKTKGTQLYTGLGLTSGYLADIVYEGMVFTSDGGSQFVKDHSKEDAHLFSLSTNVIAGVKIPVSERTNLCIEPTLRFGLTSLQESVLAYHMWSSGVNFSYRINL